MKKNFIKKSVKKTLKKIKFLFLGGCNFSEERNLYKYYEMKFREKYWEFINKNLSRPLDWALISQNPNITMDIVTDNPNQHWDYGTYHANLFKNPNITWEFVRQYIDEHEKKPNCLFDNIADFLQLFSISNNKNITLDIIKNNLRETQIKLLKCGHSPTSKAITGIDYLLEREKNKYPSYEIWYFLLQNKLVFPWNWKGITSNPNITLDIIKENPNLPWKWEWISDNPNITYEMAREINLSDFIDKYASKREEIEPGWDWDRLLLTKNITWNIVKKYPDNWVSDKDEPLWLKDEKGTRWSNLSQNTNITMNIIINNG